MQMLETNLTANLSHDEIRDRISRLSTANWVRLKKIARHYSNFSPIDPEDLLQEAFVRSMVDRHCPRNLDFLIFLKQTMRSIASDALKASSRKPTLRLVAENGKMLCEPEDESPSPEELTKDMQIIHQNMKKVKASFAGDEDAMSIFKGSMEGLEGEELRAQTKLTKTAFNSKRKFIRRQLEKLYPKKGCIYE